MKYKRVTVSVDRKVSDNNFGSYGSVVTLEAEVDEGEKVKDVLEKLRKRAEDELVSALTSIKANKELKPKSKKEQS